MTIEAAARAYIDSYDEYQTNYALARLRGWVPHQQPPKPLHDSYLAMIAAQTALRTALGVAPMNYVTEARKELRRQSGPQE